MSKIVMAVTIDTECDKSKDWSNSSPLTFKSITYGIPHVFQPLFRKFKIKPTYFLSPEVIEHSDSAKIFKLIQNNCELGTHLHSEFIKPKKKFKNFDGKLCNEFQTDYSDQIEYQKINNLTKLFKKTFKKNPKVFRSGRYAANLNTAKSLIKLGYKVESSTTPHLKWQSPKGNWIDHQKSPKQPYFIDKENFYKAGFSSLLQIPITIHKIKKFYLFDRSKWLRPFYSDFNTMKKIIDKTIKENTNKKIIVLNMMFHSMEIIPGASPYCQTDKDVRNYIQTLKNTFEYAKKKCVRFLTLNEIYNLFKI